MVKSHLSLPVCVYLAAAGALLAQNSYVFQLPGNAITGQTPQLEAVGDNDFSRILGPASSVNYAGASKVVPTPDGNKFYFVTSGGMYTASKTLKNPTALSAISGPVSDAQMTPDGKYLLVVTAHFYIVKVADDSVAALADTGVPPGASPVAVAVSHDGKTAYVLSNQSGSVLTSVDLVPSTPVATSSKLNLLSQATSMVLSPRGLLYVTAGSHLFEIDPATFALTTLGDMQMSGQAGPLQFTSDGGTAYFVNQGVSGSPLFKLNVQAHAISEVVPPTDGSASPRVDQVLVAGSSRVFALNFTTHVLYDVSPSPFTLTPSVIGVLPTGSVAAAAVSNESPSAQYLYLLFLSDHTLDRIKLVSNTVDGQPTTLDPALGSILSFAAVPAQGGAASVSVLTPSQTVAPSSPVVLVGQVLDSLGHPVMGASASFTASSASGIAINTPNVFTTSGGWAQTTVTAPSVTGIYTVTLSSGSATPGTFTLNVSSGSGGNGGGSGVPSMSIYAGDGQLLKQNESTNSTDTHVPLTVKVVDENGNPLPNVTVTFTIETGGIGFLIPRNQGLTDQNGFARADYTSGPLTGNSTTLTTKIQAVSTYGSVEFYEVTHDAKLSDVQPNSEIVTPKTTRTITVQQGVVSPGAIAVSTINEKSPGPIPNVGLRLADPNSPSDPSPVASCQGLSRGDASGISRCDVLAVCQPDTALPHNYGVFLYAGEHQGFALTITVTKGSASVLNPVTPLNQTGNPGSKFTLVANVSDGCGQPVAATGLNWDIIQGTGAILSNQQTASDTSGNVSAVLTLGSTAGVVQVRVSGPGLTPTVFNITNQVVLSGISLVSGGGQASVIVGQTFPQPIVFFVHDAQNNPVSGALVTFSATGGSVNPGSANTDAQGRAQTTVTAGSTPGNIVVTATTSTFSATANLSSRAAGPTVTAASFTNAASGAVGMTPCGFVTVTGTGVAPSVQGVVAANSFFGAYPYALAGVSITVNNIPVPIQAVANDQFGQRANFQAPCELTGDTATVVVTVNTATTTVTGVKVFSVQPGIFTYTGANNKLYGAVIREVDGTYVTATNPARQGEKVYVVVTGLGQTNPTLITNSVGTGTQNVILPTAVFLSDHGLPALSARYLFGWVGAYLVEFKIPVDSPTGPDQPLIVVETSPDGNDFLGVSKTVLVPAVSAP